MHRGSAIQLPISLHVDSTIPPMRGPIQSKILRTAGSEILHNVFTCHDKRTLRAPAWGRGFGFLG